MKRRLSDLCVTYSQSLLNHIFNFISFVIVASCNLNDLDLLVLCTGAGAGVLPYFAGAGAGVCSPPAKLRQDLFVLQTSIIDQRKN